MQKISFLIFMCLLLISCRGSEKEYTFIDKYDEHLFGIPDSLATESQQALRQACYDLFYEKAYVKNGKIVFSVDKEEMMERGIPGDYYRFMKRSLRETDRNYKKMIKLYPFLGANISLEETFEAAKRQYFENRDKQDKD